MGELPGTPELFRLIELKLLDLLTSQLDCELISHNMMWQISREGWMVSSRKGGAA